MTSIKSLWFKRMLVATIAGFFIFTSIMAQQNEQISWEDDDEEEEVVEVAEIRALYDAAVLTVNGKEFEIGETVEFEREQTLTISVKYLKPNSWIYVHIQKGGMTLDKLGWFANEHGELELEVTTGKKKISGSAEVGYYAESGKKNVVNAKVVVQ